MPPPAALLGATQTKARLPLWAAPRLALVIAAVQGAAAKQAAFLPRLFGQIGIDFFQQFIYVLIRQLFLAPVLFQSVFQHIDWREKTLAGQASAGVPTIGPGCSRKSRESAHPPSSTVQKSPPV